MNYKRFLDLSREFNEFIVSLHTLYLDSVVGFKILHKCLLEHQNQIKLFIGECEEASSKFQDKCSIDYEKLCSEKFNVVSMSPLMKQGEVKERTAHNGTNYILMGRLCVVQAYTYWETYLRKEIGIALGVLDPNVPTKKKERNGILKDYVPDDFWGDMGVIRQAILHKNGIATSKFNKMKVLTWFKPNDPINLDFDKMKLIFIQMGNFRNILHSLSLPPSNAKFPS